MKALTLMVSLLIAQGAWAQDVSVGSGAVLRGLDKIDGHITDMTLKQGGSAEVGRLRVELGQCRYPTSSPASDAYAFIVISDIETGVETFSGWMIASSPALNALEHPRYDVWVLRCNT